MRRKLLKGAQERRKPNWIGHILRKNCPRKLINVGNDRRQGMRRIDPNIKYVEGFDVGEEL